MILGFTLVAGFHVDGITHNSGQELHNSSRFHAAFVSFIRRCNGSKSLETFLLGERRQIHIGQNLDDLRPVDRRLRCRKPLDAAATSIESAPSLNYSSKSMVGSEIGVRQDHLCDGARGMLVGKQPLLDALPVVGYAGRHRHRIFHDLKRDGTEKERRSINFNLIIFCHGREKMKK